MRENFVQTPFRWEAGQILDAKNAVVASFQPAPGSPPDAGDLVADRLELVYEQRGLVSFEAANQSASLIRWFAALVAASVLAILFIDQYEQLISTKWLSNSPYLRMLPGNFHG